MEQHPGQIKLFGTNPDLGPLDRDLSRLGLGRRDVSTWHNEGFLSFDPNRVQHLERWMLDEVVFIRDLRKVEWSLNALRQLLAPLKRPYAYSHAEIFFNFQEMKWERRYRFYEMKTAIFENPDVAAEAACGLIRGVADFGTRQHLLNIREELNRALSSGQPDTGP